MTTTVLETPHVVVAAAIAAKVSNPALAIPLALGSHFVLERIPHWNPHLNSELKKFGKISTQSTRIVIADSALALSIGSFISLLMLPNFTRALTVFIACFVSVVPDLIEAPYYFLNKNSDFIVKKWIPFKKSIQEDAKPVAGLTIQFLIILTSLWWIMG